MQTLHGGDVVDGVEVPATPEEARRAAAHLAADLDVDVIKVVHDRGLADVQRLEPLSPEILEAIADEADRHGLPVVAHWGDQTDLEELLDAGVEGLEHFHPRGRMLNGWPPDSLHALSESGVHLGPTAAVMDAVRDEWSAEAWEQVQARFRELHSSGVPIIAGSDAPMNGLSFGSGLQRELVLLVEFGMTPQEALRAATSTAAEALTSDDIGVIEPGRAADLVAVVGDPLADITTMRDIDAVWRDGRPVVGEGGRTAGLHRGL